jgi:hypothetical protein
MADFVYNIAKGRVAELAARVNANDPTNSILVIAVIDTAATDGTLEDLNDLGVVLADGDTAEVTNTNYARKTIDDSGSITVTVDDTNDRTDVDLPDQTWSAVAAGDSWTDALFCYDSDSTGGADSAIVPLTQHDFAVTPDGSDITMQLNAAGFFRAA